MIITIGTRYNSEKLLLKYLKLANEYDMEMAVANNYPGVQTTIGFNIVATR